MRTGYCKGAGLAVCGHELVPPPLLAYPEELTPPNDVQQCTALFNGMIAPLCPFGIRGALWYQGEANLGEGKLYTERMKALIGGWRAWQGEGDFPFYYVQVAPYNYGAGSGGDGASILGRLKPQPCPFRTP